MSLEDGRAREKGIRAPNSESKPVIGMGESEFSAADGPPSPPLVLSLESSVGITSSGLKSGLKITQHEEVTVLHVSPYLWKYSERKKSGTYILNVVMSTSYGNTLASEKHLTVSSLETLKAKITF